MDFERFVKPIFLRKIFVYGRPRSIRDFVRIFNTIFTWLQQKIFLHNSKPRCTCHVATEMSCFARPHINKLPYQQQVCHTRRSPVTPLNPQENMYPIQCHSTGPTAKDTSFNNLCR